VTLSKKLKKLVRSVDSYGVPVSLTYKGDPQIKSFFGGLATILARTIVIAYFVYQCKWVFERDFTLETSVMKRDLSKDDKMVLFNKTNFDFGINLQYNFYEREPLV
jgi:hypothetical protein